MLPADLVGTWIARWPIFSDYGDDPAVRSIVVSYSTGIFGEHSHRADRVPPAPPVALWC
jgi:hypothetical protein